MNPENIKVNGQAVQTEKKELTPVQQWDQLAFQVIYNEICPKGFRKVKNGKYRGSEYVEMPKKAVSRVQKISAQLVRGFRDKAKEEVGMHLSAAELMFSKTPFYHFKTRIELKEQIKVLEAYKERLNNIPIK